MLPEIPSVWVRIAVSVLLLLCAVNPTLAQSEEDARAKAKTAFQHGVADYDAGHYEQALKSFEEAYRLRPHPLVEVNIANCYDKLGKPDLAIQHFEVFLSSDAGTPEQRQEVTVAVDRLKQATGKVLLHVTPDGAEVIVDQGEPKRTPFAEPLALEPGKHSIEARAAGYKSAQRTLFVKGGTTLELSIMMEQEGPPTAPVLAVTPSAEAAPATEPAPAATPAPAEQPAPAPAPAEEGKRRVPTGVWITGGLTGVLGVTAIVTGALALKAKSDFNNYKSERFDDTLTSNARLAAYSNARDSADRGRALALTTDILLGGAAVCAVVTVYLIARSGRDSEAQPSAARLTPAVAPHAAGLALNGDF